VEKAQARRYTWLLDMSGRNQQPRGAASFPRRSGYAAYDAVGLVLAVLSLPLLPVLLLTRHGRGLGERLGRLPQAAARLQRPLWVHAASVGEVLAAEPLVRALRRERPDVPVLVSTTSLSGRETARARLGADAVMLLPADVRWIVGGVVRRLQPRCLVIIETELWPALLRAAAQHRVPCIIASGRVSPRAAARYAWIRRLTGSMLSGVDAFAMQSAGDAERIIALGAAPERVQVLGSLKLARDGGTTAAPRQASGPAAWLSGRAVLLAASTHNGEETLVLDACASLWRDHPTLLLVLAPRRPQRFDEVARLLEQRSLRYERLTAMIDAPAATTQVVLVDTVGELLDFFPAARAVFVGGTVALVGGHNVLEPALFGKAVAFGPETGNVAGAAALLLDAGAAVRIHHSADLQRAWQTVLDDPAAAAAMGERGRAAIGTYADVAQRTLAMIRPYLDGAT
jgi:3-deoxy-D-manno-octulosonic-acid transferase